MMLDDPVCIWQSSRLKPVYFVRITVVTGLLLLLPPMPSLGRDVNPQQENYLPDYSIYHNLSRIQSHIEDIVLKNPLYIKLDYSYLSREGRPQLLLHVTNFTDRQWSTAHSRTTPKIKVLLSFGEHAREFFPVESLFYFLHNVTAGLTAPPGSPSYHYTRFILSKVDLFIVAIVNPDGRRLVERTANYCWRGTSTGVDLNRNFDWQFGNKGSSDNKADEEYRGAHPFSEPECNVLTELTTRYQMDAFLSLHSGIKQIYVPFADTQSKQLHRKPANIEQMLELADRMAQLPSHTFSYGVAYQLNEYTADGTTFDYMAGVRKVPFSLAVELWGVGDHRGARCFDLFNPKSRDLKSSLEAIHPLYEKFFTFVVNWKEQQTLLSMDPALDAPPLTLGYVMLGGLVLLTALIALQGKLPACLRLYPRRRIVSLRSLSSTFSVTAVLHMKL